MHRNPKNTKHWRLSWSRYETFITFFKFWFSIRGERETQFFYADCSSIVSSQLTDSTNAHPGPKNQLASSKSKSLLPAFFFKITKNRSPSLPGMTLFTSPVLFPIWGFYCDICDCHILPARAWTPTLMSASTYALSQKVLSLTTPKLRYIKRKMII